MFRKHESIHNSRNQQGHDVAFTDTQRGRGTVRVVLQPWHSHATLNVRFTEAVKTHLDRQMVSKHMK